MEKVAVRGIAHRTNIVKISLIGVPDEPGTAAKIFGKLGEQDVNIGLIVQAEHHGGKNDISFLVDSEGYLQVSPALDDLVAAVRGERVVVEEDVATVSLVGEGIQREPGIAATMFASLADEGINIDLISTSNLMLTCVVPRERVEDAVRALHDKFLKEGT